MVRNQVEKASAQEAARGKLKGAVSKQPGEAHNMSEADRARHQLLEAFTTELHDLFEAGSAIETALRLPLDAGPSAEVAVKRLVLALYRRLEEDENVSLSPKDLVLLPVLLQRLGLQDHKLFASYCVAVRKSLPELTAHDMKKLILGVEDYRLLHPVNGPALSKLVAELALAKDLEGSVLQNLTSAALSVKARSLMQPLLKELVEALEGKNAPTGPESVRFAAAATELYAAACGLKVTTLKEHLKSAAAAVEGLDDEDDLRLLALSCASKVHLAAPAEAEAIVKASINKLPTGGFAVPLESSEHRRLLFACDALPAKLRALVADKILGTPSLDEISTLRPEAALLYLRLLQDLPKLSPKPAAASPEALESLARRVLAASQDAPHPPSAIAAAFVAGGESVEAEALQLLETHWGRVTNYDLQVLFKTTSGIEGLAKRTVDNMHKIEDLRVQLGALRHLLVGGTELPIEKVKTSLLKSIAGCSNEKELSGSEALLRTYPTALPDEATALRKELSAALRTRLFAAKLEAPLLGNRRPPRGFFQYVESCTERARYWREAASPSPTA